MSFNKFAAFRYVFKKCFKQLYSLCLPGPRNFGKGYSNEPKYIMYSIQPYSLGDGDVASAQCTLIQNMYIVHSPCSKGYILTAIKTKKKDKVGQKNMWKGQARRTTNGKGH